MPNPHDLELLPAQQPSLGPAGRVGYLTFAVAAIVFSQLYYGAALAGGVPLIVIEVLVLGAGIAIVKADSIVSARSPWGALVPRQALHLLMVIIALHLAFAALAYTFGGDVGAIPVQREAIVAQFFGVLIAAPVFEEVVFRGLLFRAFAGRSRSAIAVAVALSAAAFTLFHIAYWGTLSLVLMFAFGLVLGIARAISGGVLLPILLHFAMNLCAVMAWAVF